MHCNICGRKDEYYHDNFYHTCTCGNHLFKGIDYSGQCPECAEYLNKTQEQLASEFADRCPK